MLNADERMLRRRILGTRYLMAATKKTNIEYARFRLLVYGGFVAVALVAYWAISSSLVFVGAAALALLAMAFEPRLLFKSYGSYSADWDFANSREPLLAIHFEAAETAERGDDETSVNSLRSAFEDGDDGIELFIDACRRLGGAAASRELGAIAQRNPRPGIRVFATRALGAIDSRESALALEPLQNASDRAVRATARRVPSDQRRA